MPSTSVPPGKRKSGVTVSLTGVVSTFAAGALALGLALGVVGSSENAYAGTITASAATNISVALTGQQKTFSAGSILANRSVSSNGSASYIFIGNNHTINISWCDRSSINRIVRLNIS